MIGALRLAALGIAEADAPTATEAVRHLLAVQAQDHPGTLWALGLRVPGSTRADVAAEIAGGAIVRSWPLRGTLQLVPAEDLAWMLSLTGPRMVRSAAARHRQLGITSEDIVSAERIARARLGGGGRLPRAGLLAAFAEGGQPVDGQRGVHLLATLAQTAVLVQCDRDVYALLEEWVPNPRRLRGEEALCELALRYALGHGPVTDRDLAWWAGLTLTDARTGLAAAATGLDRTERDGTTHYARPGLEPAAPGVHLLPGFDEFVLGYADRSAQLPAAYANRIVPGGNGVFLPTIVVDGRVAGTWKRVRATSRKLTVGLLPFAPLGTREMREIRERLDRYGRFLSLEIDLAS